MTSLIGKSLGRYHILEQIGRGGMATVYKAYDTRLERDVAVKIIRQGAFSPEVLERMLKRFEREAKSLAKLTHPNIVSIIDYGEYEGSPYLVMPHLPGGTLKDQTGQPVAYQRAAHLLAPVARGLAYAHQRGVLHRDVKPANILISGDGSPILTDFGIARILEGDAGGGTLTGTGVGVGTPEYMAPEQGLGKEVDGRADVYALGVVLYELVTGRKPYEAETPLAVLLKQANDPLPRPRDYVPGLPEEVEKVLMKALAKRPEDRYEDMGAFASVLERMGHGYEGEKPVRPVAQPPVRRAEPESGGGASTTMDELDVVTPHEPARRGASLRMWLLGGALAFGGLLVILAVVMALGGGEWGKISEAAKAEDTAVQAISSTPERSFTATRTALPSETIAPTASATPTAIPSPTRGIIATLISEKDGMVMVYVPEGEFKMGSDEGNTDEKPAHTVFLDAYWIDQTEVSNEMFAKFLDALGNQFAGDTGVRWFDAGSKYAEIRYYAGEWRVDSGRENNPVNVIWYGAQAYCEWAGKRLPTEAEWEKAARGTDGRKYPWGNDSPSSSLLNYHGSKRDTTEVGSYPDGASPYGALDMAGNVWEWVVDWYDEVYYSHSPASNPLGPSNGDYKVLRGGSWESDEEAVRSAIRGYSPLFPFDDGGFRCALSP